MDSLADSIVSEPDMQMLKVVNKKGNAVVLRKRNNLGVDNQYLSFTTPIVFDTETVGQATLQVSTKELENAIQISFYRILIWICSVILFLGVLIYIVVSIVILEPIARIRNTMQAIVANPNESLQTLEVSGNDELADLGHIFNTMQTSLYARQQQLRERVQIADADLVKANHELTLRSNELEKMVEITHQLATTDSLTGLKNRRCFDEIFEPLFAHSKRHEEPLCLVLLDVDKFKQINDVHGHVAGDAVLKSIGELIRQCTRGSDVSARVGGDEFAFVLTNAAIEQGKTFAQHLLEKVREHDFAISDGHFLKVTLSIGVAELSCDIHSVEALYGLADKALYESKRRERNQVTGAHKQMFF
jgi:diguanylate cyclase (GGDEF)-like protein